MTAFRTTDAALLRCFLDAIPSFVFVVDEDVRILDYNAAAGGLLSLDRKQILRRRAGDLLHCIHAADHPEGCGRGPACRGCVIRQSVRKAFSGNQRVRESARMELCSQCKVNELHVLITASPFAHEGTRMVLLVIEDISEIVALQRIIPICMRCKKVRTDDKYWTQVEAYLMREWKLRFSHGFCPECERLEHEKLDRELDGPGSHAQPQPGLAADLNRA